MKNISKKSAGLLVIAIALILVITLTGIRDLSSTYAYFVDANGTELGTGLDISRFKKLSFWIRKVSGNINQLQVGVKADGANRVISLANVNVNGGTGNGVNNSSTEWQYVEIDLTSISTVNALKKTSLPLLVICDNLTANTEFDLDNVVLKTDSLSAAFNITLKNIEDMDI